MHVAVVASGYGDPWDERHVLVRRLAGAVACSGEVDVLVPGKASESGYDGAVRLLRFPATPLDPARRRAWRLSMLGDQESDDALDCTCLSRREQRSRGLPGLAEDELVRAEGGDSLELYRHLRSHPYDVAVFVGYHSPASCWGVRAVPDECRVVLVPGARDESTLWLRIHDGIFERADKILVCTDSELSKITERLGGDQAGRLENVGFVVGVNSLARTTEPHDFDRRRYVVVPRDWTRTANVERFIRWADYLEVAVHPDLQLRLVGPGAGALPLGLRLTASRLDVWRWMSRAICVLDPRPHLLLGREVLEAMLYGTPVVVNAKGGATCEHADRGNGGLWYRTDDELFAGIEALLDEELRKTLGEQGRSYAEANFNDTDSYVKRVEEALLA
jgi:glycosyltransferase involved in cell wall biosynthesis